MRWTRWTRESELHREGEFQGARHSTACLGRAADGCQLAARQVERRERESEMTCGAKLAQGQERVIQSIALWHRKAPSSSASPHSTLAEA